MNCELCDRCVFLDYDSFDGICCLSDEYLSLMDICPLERDA